MFGQFWCECRQFSIMKFSEFVLSNEYQFGIMAYHAMLTLPRVCMHNDNFLWLYFNLMKLPYFIEWWNVSFFFRLNCTTNLIQSGWIESRTLSSSSSLSFLSLLLAIDVANGLPRATIHIIMIKTKSKRTKSVSSETYALRQCLNSEKR